SRYCVWWPGSYAAPCPAAHPHRSFATRHSRAAPDAARGEQASRAVRPRDGPVRALKKRQRHQDEKAGKWRPAPYVLQDEGGYPAIYRVVRPDPFLDLSSGDCEEPGVVVCLPDLKSMAQPVSLNRTPSVRRTPESPAGKTPAAPAPESGGCSQQR